MKTTDFCAYPTDWNEEQSLKPILREMQARGIATEVDRSMSVKSKVGLFIGHQEGNRPALSNCPIVMLHDLGQAHNVWPRFWRKESWGDYDYGLVPNRMWQQMHDNFEDPRRKPRHGLRMLGWPKSDDAYQRIAKSPESIFRFKNGRLSVLYAPSWEFNNQQDQFLQALADLPIYIFIKQQYYEKMGHNKRVEEMADLHRNRWHNVILLDSKTRIFDVLKYTDCIVSDESSTLVEGAMIGCVPVGISDWKIPDTQPPRAPSVPFSCVQQMPMAQLRNFIVQLTNESFFEQQVKKTLAFEDYYPPNQGEAASAFAQFLHERIIEQQ